MVGSAAGLRWARGRMGRLGDGLGAEGDEVGGCLNCDLGGLWGWAVISGEPTQGCLIIRGRGDVEAGMAEDQQRHTFAPLILMVPARRERSRRPCVESFS